ncbi:MAG TPA: polysaccharide deacetylase family protein, partial [Phycisphaerae bacterium]|nr:polysaccharide deacetylase family protein [Phycisphaerae bacterium]
MKLATISLDDGHERDRGVIEVLDRFGIKATFYITCGMVSRLDPAWYAEHEIGNHTMTHPRKGLRDVLALASEVGSAMALLQKWSGQEVKPFAYPCGKATIEYAIAARDAGHTMARTYAIDPENAYQIPEPFLVPVTGYLDKPISWPLVQSLLDAGKPIHLAGHGKHFADEVQLRS